jgi:putative spermidine/putrescine transport system ATP-binding protein
MTLVTDSSIATQAGPSASRGAPVVFDNLTRRFGATTALDAFSLAIAPGDLIALLGPSGCGKTTALRVLAGFERPDVGRILVDEKDVSTIPAQRRNMGMVFQSYSLFPNMDARDNVAFGLQLRHHRASARRARSAELLELVGLGEHLSKYPHQLSGGQQQRVALARALAIEPRVLLLDEPLSALDAKVRAELRDQIRSIQQRLAITTVFVTHDQEVLYSQPATPFVGQFVGVSSRMAVTRHGDHVEVLGRDVPIRGDLNAVPTGELEALLRPEDLDVVLNPSGLGVITHRSFLGATTRVGVGIAGATLRVDVRSAQADDLELGTRVDVRVTARDVLVTTPRPTN